MKAKMALIITVMILGCLFSKSYALDYSREEIVISQIQCGSCGTSRVLNFYPYQSNFFERCFYCNSFWDSGKSEDLVYHIFHPVTGVITIHFNYEYLFIPQIMEKGLIFVPVRMLSENLGFSVYYTPLSRGSVFVFNEKRKIVFNVCDKNVSVLQGQERFEYFWPVSSIKEFGVIYVPLVDFAEALGYGIEYRGGIFYLIQ